MHEYHAVQNVVNQALEEAKKAGAGKITEIKLAIGDLSTFLNEPVQMYFDIIAKGTIAEGAKLTFRRIPAELMCKSCGQKFDKPDKGFDCPVCGSEGIPTGAGSEFYIESIEVE